MIALLLVDLCCVQVLRIPDSENFLREAHSFTASYTSFLHHHPLRLNSSDVYSHQPRAILSVTAFLLQIIASNQRFESGKPHRTQWAHAEEILSACGKCLRKLNILAALVVRQDTHHLMDIILFKVALGFKFSALLVLTLVAGIIAGPIVAAPPPSDLVDDRNPQGCWFADRRSGPTLDSANPQGWIITDPRPASDSNEAKAC
ncbi:hypothetical protein B0H19DRAFT_1277629 [Mycena capillaripes]|nr:hypothetical protein B0H19DRAFT_1277629 [Mycena capillaripes]